MASTDNVDEFAYTGYVVQNKLSHSRLIPKESKHTFVYSTPYLCVSLNALESHKLDKGNGWLFGYGGIAGRITGLRESTYMQPAAFPGQTIKQKIEVVLKRRGYDLSELEDVWMLTMPAYLGYEGMNPLTTYFAYKKDGSPWMVILEIHNTFYERHVHILEVNESSRVPKESHKGYDYHWLFPREFHVSPFNDRSGFYGISVVLPFDSAPSPANGPPPTPRGRIRVDLFTESTKDPSVPGPLKLIATVDPQTAVPFTSSALVNSLAVQPIVLLLAWSRILYNAWVLHYVKHLDVFVRPEPRPAVPNWATDKFEESDVQEGEADASARVLLKNNGAYTLSLDLRNEGTQTVSGGVGWQSETSAEAFARKRVEEFLKRRVQELGIDVLFVPANPAIPQRHFRPTQFFSDEKPGSAKTKKLTISHASSTVFATLFMTPSAEYALAMGEREQQFSVSDRELFLRVFSSEDARTDGQEMSRAQRLRVSQIPASSAVATYAVPSTHAIEPSGTYLYVLTLWTLLNTFFIDWYTELIYRALGARFVAGQEPWGWRVWERVGGSGSKMHEYLEKNVHEEGYVIGSVRTV
ncbi:hypothetical protein BDW22DRAFT_951665 [Trametopsis cervina]|nr:hypothetical protein BDW22DRAFT_951665 [Trametopsis cervina]